MSLLKRFSLAGIAGIAGTGMLMSATAVADDVNCPPDLGAVEIDGNVLVAAPCRLDGTTVKGSVELFAGGSLTAVNATIIGNIQATTADFIDVDSSEINGSIQLDDTVGTVNRVANSTVGGSVQQSSSLSRLELTGNVIGADVQAFSNAAEVVVDDNEITGSVQLEGVQGATSRVSNSTVNGSIQLSDNSSRLEIAANTIGADAQAFGNTGGVTIADNVIDGNLQCKENDPAPTGGNNQVSGNKEDQCANLVPGGGAASAGGPVVSNSASGSPPAGASSGGGAAGPLFAALALLPLLRRIRKVVA